MNPCIPVGSLIEFVASIFQFPWWYYVVATIWFVMGSWSMSVENDSVLKNIYRTPGDVMIQLIFWPAFLPMHLYHRKQFNNYLNVLRDDS